jgi:predicted enzyme related to lactoylglutathione lyase
MRLLFPLLAAALFSTPAIAQQTPAQQNQGTAMTPAPIVFFDIAGPADAKLSQFYKDVFGWEASMGPNLAIPIAGPPLMGTIRTDPADKAIYIGVKDVTATLGEIVKHGGAIHAPRFEVPGVVILGLFRDPAGNFMGLVEMGPDGKAKVP